MKLLSLTLAINAHITAQTSVETEQKMTEQKRKRRAKYLLIADALKQAIKQGQVVPSETLPSARTLATQLNVNRHTIMAAVAELVAQGWIEAKERSGYRIVNKLPIQTSKTISNLTVEHQTFDWQFRHKKTTATAAVKGASAYIYNFSGGQPDNRLFPFNEFKHYFSQLFQHPKFTNLGYDNNVGETDLITQVSTYLRRARSITNKEIMICNGSQEGLYMISKLLLQAGDKVAVEQYGYPPAWAAFKSSGAELAVIEQDHKGIIPEYLATQLAKGDIKLIYLTPLHQYPTTVTLDVSRRMQIYQLAAQYGVAIVEDDYDHEFHYDSQPIAPMAADDPLGLVIYISTFSKLMFGGARIGYVVANNALITELTAYKTLMNHKSNVLMQQAVAKWMQQGGFESHLRRMTRCYHKRRDFLVNLLRGYQQQGLPITFDCPPGGMALWVDMGVSIVGLKQTLLTKDVYLQTEVDFNLVTEHLITEQDKSQYRFIRVGFASMNEVEITQGMKIIVQELYG
ncbi:PLP-dependent aminotransferase family protein [Moritella sp. 28]|uniref:MocR-like pyridoxine biosynthesis transcription factor PdxR n=1 Tax=Moritella sp. 28 TaxID=2746232 RepID=UPI0021053F8B|nr:PLP-dependent aminotransferase family protein [Moritella sp. 28]